MRASLLVVVLVALMAPAAAAAPCPGAAECPYSSVRQISAPPAADEVRAATQLALGPGGGLWAADGATTSVVRLSPAGVVQGSVGAGTLTRIAGLAVSPTTGDVYVTEGYQGRVVRLSGTGQVLGSVDAGSGLGQVTNPVGIAVRPGTGRVYVTESSGGRTMQSFDAALGSPVSESSASEFGDGSQIAFTGDGTALWAVRASYGLARFAVADLATPTFSGCPAGGGVGQCQLAGVVNGIAVDDDGRVWIPDRYNNRIQRFDADGANPVAYGGIGSGALGFVLPQGIAADGASIVVSDLSGRIRRYDRTTLALQSTVGGPSLAGLRYPALAVAPDGSVLQQDLGASLIRRVGADGSVLATFGATGTSPGQFFLPSSIATDPAGNILMTDQLGRRVQKLTPTGALVWSKGPLDFSDPDRLLNATGVAAGPDGTVYVADANARRVMIYGASGDVTGVFGKEGTADGEFKSAEGLVVDAGSVYVADSTRIDVQRFSTSGAFQGRLGGAGGGAGQFLRPTAIAADGRGAVFVLDAGASKVQIFGRDGTPRGSFGEPGTGPGQLSQPTDLAADGGGVVVSDASGRVQRFALPQPQPQPAGPPPSGRDATPPKVTLRVKPQRIRDVLRRGLRVTCVVQEPVTCRVTVSATRRNAARVKLKLRRGAKELEIGRATRRVTRATQLTVRLSAAARRALAARSRRAFPIVIRASATDGSGNVGRRSLSLKLGRSAG